MQKRTHSFVRSLARSSTRMQRNINNFKNGQHKKVDEKKTIFFFCCCPHVIHMLLVYWSQALFPYLLHIRTIHLFSLEWKLIQHNQHQTGEKGANNTPWMECRIHSAHRTTTTTTKTLYLLLNTIYFLTWILIWLVVLLQHVWCKYKERNNNTWHQIQKWTKKMCVFLVLFFFFSWGQLIHVPCTDA